MTEDTRFSEQRLNVFRDEFFDSQFMRTLAHQTYGGAELGECFWAAAQIKSGDFASWVNVWRQLAQSVESQANTVLDKGHLVSAREAFLRASNYYRSAELLLNPNDPQHREMWQRSRACFQKAGDLFNPPFERVSISFDGHSLPGYFIPAISGGQKRPTVIVLGGGDSSGEELYFYMGAGARQREFHVLLVEGPGQRGVLHLNPGLVFRYDYEVPLKAVVDYALSRPEVDGEKLALYGLSLGGYLVLRAAAFEKRIQACIANPPYLDFAQAQRKGLPAWIRTLNPQRLDSLLEWVARLNPLIRFALDTYYWILGVEKPSQIFSALEKFTLAGLEGQITCPVLLIIGRGEGKEILSQGRLLYERLPGEKSLRVTEVTEGADAHCVSNNLSLMNQLAFDWLAEILGSG